VRICDPEPLDRAAFGAVGPSRSRLSTEFCLRPWPQLTSLWRVACLFVDGQQLLLYFGVTRSLLKKDMHVLRPASTTSYGVPDLEWIIVSGSPAENNKEDAKIRN
jgi:hypothetical protein